MFVIKITMERVGYRTQCIYKDIRAHFKTSEIFKIIDDKFSTLSESM
jgi:hypothetical protein